MAETKDQESGPRRSWRKPSEPFPWAKFYWRDWLSKAPYRAMTMEQRGRFMEVFALTHGTRTPGVMLEDDVRAWAGYSPEEWKRAREPFARLFNLRRRRGQWVLEDVLEAYEASLRASKFYHERAQKGVAARRSSRSELAATSATSGPQQVELQVAPQVDTDVRGSDSRDPDTRGKTASDSRAARAQTSRSRAGSAGVAGPSRESRLEPIVARALSGNPPAKGGSA